MFVDVAGPPIPYEDPWQRGFEDRLSDLMAGERRIAYFSERPNSHTFRYRVFNMVEALQAQPELGVSASWFTHDDGSQGLRFVDRADALVLCRARYDQFVSRLISRARARDIPVLFDIDDLIFDIRHAHAVGAAISRSLRLSEEWDWWFGEIGRIGATLQLCDGAITTNAFLAGRIVDFAPSIIARVVPNFYNRRQGAVSHMIFQRKCSTEFQRDERVHIGYFSGTNTHANDFKIVEGALTRLLSKNPQLRLRIVGSLELPVGLEPYAGRIEQYPIQDFINLQRLQSEAEICVAPLRNSMFTECKSNLKYFEAALTGVAVVASPAFAFREAISDGENGYLAHAQNWEEKISELVALLEEDPPSYEGLVRRAAAHAERLYRWDRQADKIINAVFSVVGSAEFGMMFQPNREPQSVG